MFGINISIKCFATFYYISKNISIFFVLFVSTFDIVNLLFYYHFGNSRRLSVKFLCNTLPHMGIRAGVVVAVTFQQVDDAPHAETSAEGDHEGLKNGDSLIEEFHTSISRNHFEKFD